jgi:tRNA A37 N6-isopentenylltransferase MiaA
MRRIIVVACQGSGKTSLALKLGRKLGLPVVHLDCALLAARLEGI